MRRITLMLLIIAGVFSTTFASSPKDAVGNDIPVEVATEFLERPVISVPVSDGISVRTVSDSHSEDVVVTISNVVEWAAKAASSLQLPTFIILIITALKAVIDSIIGVIDYIKTKKSKKS